MTAVNVVSTVAFNPPPEPPLPSRVVELRGGSARILVNEPARAWLPTVKARFDELVQLSKGWDGYRAVPVSFVNANFALRMLEAICGAEAPCPQMVPGTAGDLQIEWHTPIADIELHVLGPNQVHAWRLLHGQQHAEELMLGNDFTSVAAWIKNLSEPPLAAGIAAA
jgi:hypothetical protein